MPSSVNGWTMPDWSTYDLRGIQAERARCEAAIKEHANKATAEDYIDMWQSTIQSIDAYLAFCNLAGGKHEESK